MNAQIKYIFSLITTIPLLPILYFQGRRIRRNVTELPEAKEPRGRVYIGKSYPTINVLFIGESTIAGVGVEYHKDGFAGSVSQRLSDLTSQNIEWVVVARSGYTCQRVAEKLIQHIPDKKFDLIVVGLGGNDAFRMTSPSKWIEYNNLLLSKLRTLYPEAFVAYANMPPIREFPAFTPLIKFVIGRHVELLGKVLDNWSREQRGVFYANEVITIKNWCERLNIQGDVDLFFSDGVHPSPLTYKTWGKQMALEIVDYNERNNEK